MREVVRGLCVRPHVLSTRKNSYWIYRGRLLPVVCTCCAVAKEELVVLAGDNALAERNDCTAVRLQNDTVEVKQASTQKHARDLVKACCVASVASVSSEALEATRAVSQYATRHLERYTQKRARPLHKRPCYLRCASAGNPRRKVIREN